MPNLEREVSEIARELMTDHKTLTEFEALQVAVQVQHNRVLTDAYLVGQHAPTVFEKIAMELGADSGNSIKDAINNLASSISDLKEQH